MMTGILSYKEHQAMREEERQKLISNYEHQGYSKSWAIEKADYDIEQIRLNNIAKLTALIELSPLD